MAGCRLNCPGVMDSDSNSLTSKDDTPSCNPSPTLLLAALAQQSHLALCLASCARQLWRPGLKSAKG